MGPLQAFLLCLRNSYYRNQYLASSNAPEDQHPRSQEHHSTLPRRRYPSHYSHLRAGQSLLLQELLLRPVASVLGVVVEHMNNANTRLEDSGECTGRNMELFWIRWIY